MALCDIQFHQKQQWLRIVRGESRRMLIRRAGFVELPLRLTQPSFCHEGDEHYLSMRCGGALTCVPLQPSFSSRGQPSSTCRAPPGHPAVASTSRQVEHGPVGDDRSGSLVPQVTVWHRPVRDRAPRHARSFPSQDCSLRSADRPGRAGNARSPTPARHATRFETPARHLSRSSWLRPSDPRESAHLTNGDSPSRPLAPVVLLPPVCLKEDPSPPI